MHATNECVYRDGTWECVTVRCVRPSAEIPRIWKESARSVVGRSQTKRRWIGGRARLVAMQMAWEARRNCFAGVLLCCGRLVLGSAAPLNKGSKSRCLWRSVITRCWTKTCGRGRPAWSRKHSFRPVPVFQWNQSALQFIVLFVNCSLMDLPNSARPIHSVFHRTKSCFVALSSMSNDCDSLTFAIV